MKSEIIWKVVTVLGHELEENLQRLSDSAYEIVAIEQSCNQWVIIARTGNATSKQRTIGFAPNN